MLNNSKHLILIVLATNYSMLLQGSAQKPGEKRIGADAATTAMHPSCPLGGARPSFIQSQAMPMDDEQPGAPVKPIANAQSAAAAAAAAAQTKPAKSEQLNLEDPETLREFKGMCHTYMKSADAKKRAEGVKVLLQIEPSLETLEMIKDDGGHLVYYGTGVQSMTRGVFDETFEQFKSGNFIFDDNSYVPPRFPCPRLVVGRTTVPTCIEYTASQISLNHANKFIPHGQLSAEAFQKAMQEADGQKPIHAIPVDAVADRKSAAEIAAAAPASAAATATSNRKVTTTHSSRVSEFDKLPSEVTLKISDDGKTFVYSTSSKNTHVFQGLKGEMIILGGNRAKAEDVHGPINCKTTIKSDLFAVTLNYK